MTDKHNTLTDLHGVETVCNTIILNFLLELKHAYSENEKIYSQGSCFRLYKMLKTVFPKAKPFYSTIDGHWVTEIEGSFYDINGELSKEYVEDLKYEDKSEDEVILASAYVPRYGGIGVKYSKYKKTV